MKTTKIYIVRHGESEGNIKEILGFSPEVKLTDRGIQQVKDLSKNLSFIKFDYIFSSDLLRAKHTAKILALEIKAPIKTRKNLRERSYGRLNGKTKKEIRKELNGLYDEYLKLNDKDKYYFKLTEDMETVDDSVSRLMVVLKEIVRLYEGKTILIVSHVTPMRGLLVRLGYLDFHEIDSNCVENTALIKLDSDGANFFIKETRGIRKKI